jgi:protein-tyrosine-phosphatase
MASRPAILFVCHGNTCRSVLAEYLGRHRLGPGVHVESAGLIPGRAADAKNAIDTLRSTFGLDASAHVPRSIRDLRTTDFDMVVAIEPAIARAPELAGVDRAQLIVWNIRDPWGGDLSEYDSCALSIVRALAELRKRLASSSTR